MKKGTAYIFAASLLLAVPNLLHAHNGHPSKLLKSTMENGSIKLPVKRVPLKDLAVYSERSIRAAMRAGNGFFSDTISGDLYVTGNMGIGTTSPSSMLHLYTETTNPVIRMQKAGATNNPDYFMGSDESNNAFFIGRWNIAVDLALKNGNVGIGTGSPTQNLDVQAASSADGFIRVAGGAGSTKGGVLLGNASGNYGELVFDNASNNLNLFQKYASGDLLLGTNSTTNMAIKNGGNIGIGTTNPSEKLEVVDASGTTQKNLARFSNTTNGSYSSFFAAGSSSAVSSWTNGSQGLEMVPYSTGKGIISAYTGSLVFQTNNRSDRMTITNAGKVGIGTTNPQELLSVNGNILAKRVKVSVLSADWPDYVFSKEYKLKPLNEVEAFIKQHNHLPEVPSATEMEKKSMDVGDNQAILLKKVEELTLYLIEQNKKNEEQNKKIAALEQQVQQLKKSRKP